MFFSINVWEEKFSIMRALGFPRRAAEEQADYWQEWMGGIMSNWAQFSHSITCLCIDERCSLCNRKERKKEMWQKWKQGEKNNNTNAVKSHWLNTAWEKRVIWKVKNRLSVSISNSNKRKTHYVNCPRWLRERCVFFPPFTQQIGFHYQRNNYISVILGMTCVVSHCTSFNFGLELL